MKQFWKEFFLRGLLAASGGPVVLAVVYGILGATGVVTHFSPREVCLGILTVTLLAFTVAGMTAIYQMEQLPLPTMISVEPPPMSITPESPPSVAPKKDSAASVSPEQISRVRPVSVLSIAEKSA